MFYSQLGEQIGNFQIFYQDPKDLTPSYCKGMFVTFNYVYQLRSMVRITLLKNLSK